MKVVYTKSAEREARLFEQRQRLALETLISERKRVFGDDIIEITASDIKDAAASIQVVRPSVRSRQMSELLSRAYILIGIAMVIGSFLYPQIKSMLLQDKNQAMLLFVGVIMTLIGALAGGWIKARNRRYEAEAQSAYYLKVRQIEKGIDSSSDQQEP